MKLENQSKIEKKNDYHIFYNLNEEIEKNYLLIYNYIVALLN